MGLDAGNPTESACARADTASVHPASRPASARVARPAPTPSNTSTTPTPWASMSDNSVALMFLPASGTLTYRHTNDSPASTTACAGGGPVESSTPLATTVDIRGSDPH